MGTVTACPECDSTLIYERKRKRPPWRCNECGEEFGEPTRRDDRRGGNMPNDAKGPRIPDDTLLDDLRRVDEETDGTVTYTTFLIHGDYAPDTVSRRFGGWPGARRAAGIADRSNVGKADIRRDIQRVADDLGRVPIGREYDEQGAYTVSMAVRRFGSWREAVEAAGLDARAPGDRVRELESLDPEDLGLSPIGERDG